MSDQINDGGLPSFADVEFAPKKAPAPGSLVEGTLICIGLHIACLFVTFWYTVYSLVFLQWFYLLPLFYILRSKERFESAQGVVIGAMVGTMVSLYFVTISP